MVHIKMSLLDQDLATLTLGIEDPSECIQALQGMIHLSMVMALVQFFPPTSSSLTTQSFTHCSYKTCTFLIP